MLSKPQQKSDCDQEHSVFWKKIVKKLEKIAIFQTEVFSFNFQL